MRGELKEFAGTGEFGMKFDHALGSGNMLVADKVKLVLDISAAKQA